VLQRQGLFAYARDMTKWFAVLTVTMLAIAACGSPETSREAAPTESLPACTDGFAAECLISPGADDRPIAIRNGARIIIGDGNGPAEIVSVSEVCWSGEGETDPNTCVAGMEDLPEWISIDGDSKVVDGTSWPSYSIAVQEVPDSNGEQFFPLPAIITFVVGDSPTTNVSVEVACCDGPGNVSSQALQGSTKTFVQLENTLALSDGTPLPVTWKVSATQNKFWDGSSRPDHAPPQGIQGLVQDSGAPPYRVRLEVADQALFSSDNPNFTLTPTVTLNGKEIALEPWTMVFDAGNKWGMVFYNGTPQVTNGCRTSQVLSASDAQEAVQYQVVGTCRADGSNFLIKSAP
jgi:hypothetical protein